MRLPDFLVLGLTKCGTTSLHLTLEQHPEICLSLQKETWFFDQNFEKGVEWYKERFWHCQKGKKIGEVTTSVLLIENFHLKLKQILPDAKFIVLLRDPIERCVSHYWHNVRVGGEKLSLAEALEQEQSRAYKNRESYSWFAYQGIGERYKQYIEALYSVFGREKVMVVLMEELAKDARRLDDIFSFIGVRGLDQKLPRAHAARMPYCRFLQHCLNLPNYLREAIYNSKFIQEIIPLSIKRKTRILRAEITSFCEAIPKLGYKEFKKPSPPIKIRKNLEQKFNEELKGLDKLIDKPLSKYWNWFQ